ncbi:MAG: DoxX family protein [Kofleriaceae bacterium]
MITLPAFTKPFLRVADAAQRAGLGVLILRLVLGYSFFRTGMGKLQNLDRIIGYFDSLGIPAASIQAPMVATIECVGGLLLLVGLGTRVVAGLLTGVMAVALATAIIPDAEGFHSIISSIEAAYLAAFVYLAVNGGGAASIDHRLWRRAE